MADLVVAGAGMAGLVAAAHARALGADVVVHEKGDRAGGAMLLSSGVVWRHRSFDDWRAECPRGDAALQRLVFDRLDADLEWLERLGARVTDRSTGNPRTAGTRFDTASLTRALVAAVGAERIRLGDPLDRLPGAGGPCAGAGAPEGPPLLLATGGFPASRRLLLEHVTPQAGHLLLRTTPWSAGDGLRLGLEAGGLAGRGLGEIYARNMPAPPAEVPPAQFAPLAQLWAREAALVESLDGEQFVARAWSEIDVAQWTARQPGARARYTAEAGALRRRVAGGRTVGELIEAAERAGAPVERERGRVTVEVVAGVTSTLGGLRVDASGRVAPGVWAAGSDAGGTATGGYASGLAAALVLVRVAAEAALDGREERAA